MGRVGLAEVIVVDTSALVAIAFAEPERDAFVDIVHRSRRVLISTPEPFNRSEVARRASKTLAPPMTDPPSDRSQNDLGPSVY